eukprot:TRINITY_DN16232_c0_g3_i1.p1 TRINITY_DN16232_c0_g3~~TRINITY_DN16232_c0_g3_i1.p1  ORF type:complete len:523 (-),score=59.76 TRINITY_DN16232_c0_g3_i1:32-1531(-)
MASATLDFYELLQISEQASPSEIRAAYRRAALRCHPDKGGTPERFQMLVRAFETLSDDRRRHSFDLRRGKERRGTAHAGHSMQGCDAQRFCAEGSSRKSGGCTHDSQCAGGPSPSGQRKSSIGKEKATTARSLHTSLDRLRRAIERVPAWRRNSLIDGLDMQVKIHLVKWMEVSGSKSGKDFQVMPAGSDSDTEASRSDSEDSGEFQAICDVDAKEEIEIPVLPESADGFSDSAEGFERSAYTKKMYSTGVDRITCKNGSVVYRARSTFSCLGFVTKCQSELDIVIDQHIMLMQIRRAICRLADDGADTVENIQISIEDVLTTNQMSADDIGLRTYAYFWMFHRSFVSPVLPLKDVLVWRCRMMQSKSGTAADFRAMCLELLQHPARRTPCSREKAEAIMESFSETLDSKWGKFQLRKTFFFTGSKKREELVKSAARSVGRAIKASSLEKALEVRRAAVQEANKRKRLEIERHKWLHRKPGRDMTMEDLQQRLPKHLCR